MKRIKLLFYDNDIELSSNDLSIGFQGWLMERLPNDIATTLHSLDVNPYSIYSFVGKHECFIELNILNDELFEVIDSVIKDEIVLTKGVFSIKEKSIKEIDSKYLANIFYRDDVSNQLEIHFNSPCSFKSNGEYVLFPSVRHIFQSLMSKYSSLMENDKSVDEELLDSILEKVKITSYNLKSDYYRIHNVMIPGFSGRIRITINGAQTLKAYILMLLEFGQYSGVGIKSSMGMGNIVVQERRKNG